jgi:hypothetical protein
LGSVQVFAHRIHVANKIFEHEAQVSPVGFFTVAKIVASSSGIMFPTNEAVGFLTVPDIDAKLPTPTITDAIGFLI